MPRGQRKRDPSGRRVFRSEVQAFKAQRAALLELGIRTAVVRRSDGMLVLLHDPNNEEAQANDRPSARG
jgi:hypothetical protein